MLTYAVQANGQLEWESEPRFYMQEGEDEEHFSDYSTCVRYKHTHTHTVTHTHTHTAIPLMTGRALGLRVRGISPTRAAIHSAQHRYTHARSYLRVNCACLLPTSSFASLSMTEALRKGGGLRK